MSYIYKKYNLICEDCKNQFSQSLWNRDGKFEIELECDKCKSHNVHEYYQNSNVPMINTRENWKKKLPEGYKEFLGEFKNRHSKYGRTIDI